MHLSLITTDHTNYTEGLTEGTEDTCTVSRAFFVVHNVSFIWLAVYTVLNVKHVYIL
jgi:hypothetical protein